MASNELYDSASEISSIHVLDEDISDTNSLSGDDTAVNETDERLAQEENSTAAQAAKAIEAAEDSSPSATADTPFAGPSLVRVPVFVDEQTPLLDAGPAPPDYAAATAWRRASASTSNDNRPSEVAEEEPLLPFEETQTIGLAAPPNYFTEPNDRFTPFRKKRSKRAHFLRRCLCIICFIGVALLISILLLLQITANWPEKRRQRIAERDHINTETCHFDRYSEYATFSFEDPQGFLFKDTGDYSIEVTDDSFPLTVRTGDVNLYAAPRTQQAPVEVWVSVATTDPWEVARLRFVEGWDSLAMVTPLIRRSNKPDTQSPEQCVHTWVGIFVQTNVTLELLKINAGFMNVSLGYADPVWVHHRKGEDMSFQNLTVLTAKHGHIDAHYMDAQRTRLKTSSGNISGIYALRDELLVESADGAADITVDPAPDGAYPGAPPWFTVKTNWNPIGFFWPIFHPPDIPKNESGVIVQTGYGFWDGLTLISYIKMTRPKMSTWF